LQLGRRDRERVGVVLRALSSAFLALPADAVPDGSLARGHAGVAVVHHALARAVPGRGHDRRAARALDRAIDEVARMPTGDSLHHGFTGVGWAALRLGGAGAVDAIDAALLGRLAQSPWRDRFDVSNGLAGLGVYALERGHRPLIEAVIDRLEEAGERRRRGVAWRSRRDWLPPASRAGVPEWNLGVAHGTPGVVGFLAGAIARVDGGVHARAVRLLERAVAWLLAAERKDGGFGLATTLRRRARLGWCYGDPGVACVLARAGVAAGEPAWIRAARRLARRAAARSVEASGVVDAGLCHGAAGVVHMLDRLHEATGDRAVGAAARAWLDRLLALRRDDGIAGFPARMRDDAGRDAWRAEPGLLLGAGGVAVVLASLVHERAGGWDRAFLIS
jgi:hypothetical protein